MRGRTAVLALLAALASAAGCKGSGEPPKKDLGQQTGDVIADTHTLQEASSAVNEVLRNADDCELAKPHVATANAKLDEVAPRVRTTTGRATLDALRKQVRTVQQNCP